MASASQLVQPDVGGLLVAGGSRLQVPAGALPGALTVGLAQLPGAGRTGTALLTPVGPRVAVDVGPRTLTTPVVLTLGVPAAAAAGTLVLLQRGVARPVAVAGRYLSQSGTWTGSIDRSGSYQLAEVSTTAVRARIAATVAALLPSGTTAGEPPCASVPARRASGSLTIATGLRGPVWPCVYTNADPTVGIAVHVADLSGLPWRITSPIGKPVSQLTVGSAPVRTVDGLVLAAAAGSGLHGLLAPGGGFFWTLNGGTAAVAMHGAATNGIWLAVAVSAGVLRTVEEALAGHPVGMDVLRRQLGVLRQNGPAASCMATSGIAAADGTALAATALVPLVPTALACGGAVADEAGVGGAADGDLATALVTAVGATPQALASVLAGELTAAAGGGPAGTAAGVSTSWSVRTFAADPCRQGAVLAANCSTVAAIDLDGDHRPDLVGLVRPPGSAPTIAVRVLTAKGLAISARRTLQGWPTGSPVWIGTADVDGTGGPELILGDGIDGGRQSFRVLALRGDHLADVEMPGTAGPRWTVSSTGTLEGIARTGTDRFSGHELLTVSVMTPNPGGATYTDTATSWEYGAGRWFRFVAGTTVVSAAGAAALAGWHLGGLPTFAR